MKKIFIGILLGSLVFTACDKLDQLPQSTASRNAVFGTENGLEIVYKFLLWNGFSSQKLDQPGRNVRLPGSKNS